MHKYVWAHIHLWYILDKGKEHGCCGCASCKLLRCPFTIMGQSATQLFRCVTSCVVVMYCLVVLWHVHLWLAFAVRAGLCVGLLVESCWRHISQALSMASCTSPLVMIQQCELSIAAAFACAVLCCAVGCLQAAG